MPSRLLIASVTALLAVLVKGTPASAEQRCMVTDPTGTPLNVRAAPNGAILGSLFNGTMVTQTGTIVDARGRSWALIEPEGEGKPGWVWREFVSCIGPTRAEAAPVQPEGFSYPVGLNPNGDNFLAFRSLPSAAEGVRLAKLGPGTLFKQLGRSGDWVQVRLLSGDVGWVSARFVACCRAATSEDSGPSVVEAPAPPSCDDLWYQRNAIYRAAGYCFRTSRGIQAFGNAGCRYDNEADVPLSSRQRDEIAAIQSGETLRACSR